LPVQIIAEAEQLPVTGGISRSAGPCHLGIEAVNRQRLGPWDVDPMGSHALDGIRMTHLNAIAATSTAHLWWRGQSFAARWRD